MNSTTKHHRSPSALDRACDAYIRDLTSINPEAKLDWGLGEDQGELSDYSPAGIEAQINLQQGLLATARQLDAELDAVDRITAAALEDRFELSRELHEAEEDLSALNNLASPLQDIRSIFDMMPTATDHDWELYATRLQAVEGALRGYRESLELAASHGHVAARRQVAIGIKQAHDLSLPDSFFADLARDAADRPSAMAVSKGAQSAMAAYGELSEWLSESLLPLAPQGDGVGRERYERFSALFVGARVDLDETYEWGRAELDRIDQLQSDVARELYGPGVSVTEALARLNDDPAHQIRGTEALREWMQATADQAITDLAGTEFDIPDPIRTIECMIAPTPEGGIYYTGPSSDFSRPGRMWWSIPTGEDLFHTWQEKTTVYHEGVPGHHLQIGQAIYEKDTLNLWRSLDCWNSGHAEGWALYAEQLMADLGYHSDPADLMGVLDGQRLRAARVVLDIGVHLGKPRLDGAGTWDYDYAWEFLKRNVAMSDGFLRFELDRYVGWPGQAPSYKIGQRLWEGLRDKYLARSTGGSAASVRRQFHTDSLRLGSLPMGVLDTALFG